MSIKQLKSELWRTGPTKLVYKNKNNLKICYEGVILLNRHEDIIIINLSDNIFKHHYSREFIRAINNYIWRYLKIGRLDYFGNSIFFNSMTLKPGIIVVKSDGTEIFL